MQLLSLTSAAIAAASLPLASAQLNYYAQKAGLTYFGSATDTPGFRERAGLQAAYAQYDAIMADTKEFGQTTPTNGMKWMFIEPEQGVFNYTEGDIVADLAKKNGQLLRCHTLVWHSQLASWVEARNWTAAELGAVIVNHITNVMTHYKGRCAHWDVVNEAIEDDGTWRNSIFYRTMGTDYIKLAFKTAALVDPSAKLYYNDYNLERVRDKSKTAVKLVQMLKADGIRIDGVGMQGHLTVGAVAPPIDQYIEVYKMYTAEGVEIALTELDVRLTLPTNEANLAVQKTIYANVVGACAQVKGCVGVTLWDWYDPFSWIPYVFEGTGAAHLWFADFSKHPAYYGIIDALKNATKHECKARRAAPKRSAKLLKA